MRLTFAPLTQPGSSELSAKGILAVGFLLTWSVVFLMATDDGVLDFFGWLMAVPAATLLLTGAVARGIQIAREEEQAR